jgi:predicted transcriptional regulator YdeE
MPAAGVYGNDFIIDADSGNEQLAMRTAFATLILATLVLANMSAILIAGETSMPKVVHQTAFSIAGIEVRTSNAKEATSEGVIGKQWQKFFQDGVLQKIPNKIDGNVYAVYSDYASDHNGEYSLTIGAKIADGSQVPAGFVVKTVPAGNYAVVTSEKGPVAGVVIAAWQRVWDLEQKKELGGTRAYKADFEFYDQRAANPQEAQVDIYLGLK